MDVLNWIAAICGGLMILICLFLLYKTFFGKEDIGKALDSFISIMFVITGIVFTLLVFIDFPNYVIQSDLNKGGKIERLEIYLVDDSTTINCIMYDTLYRKIYTKNGVINLEHYSG